VNGQFQTINAPGAVSTIAEGINNLGEIVGTFYDGEHYHGFVDLQGKFDIVNAPGATDTFVHGVNDFGQIVGDSRAARPPPWMVSWPPRREGCRDYWLKPSPMCKRSPRT
jgi:uncharacterized membrane protein